jgi:hypothetical protein
MDYPLIKARALEMGITALETVDLDDYAPLSDGCSGGLSWLYVLSGKEISCYRCCVTHDFLYEWGCTAKDRKKADKLLRWCASKSGDFSGWQGPFFKAWRWFRSWVMYGAVRVFGGGKEHWAGE